MGKVVLIGVVACCALVTMIMLPLAFLTAPSSAACQSAGGAVVVGPPGSGTVVGASTFGGPKDVGTGSTGYRGDDLNAHPDSYAELSKQVGLGSRDFSAMGNLPYKTALRVTAPTGKSAVLYKRDVGAGGAAVNGHPRVIDLWYQAATSLGLPQVWLGNVKIERVSASQAASAGGQSAGAGGGGDCTDAGYNGGNGQWAWPVSPHPISSVFCQPRSYEACHPGLDIAVPSGTKIHAVADGRVASAGWNDGYGNYTCIQHNPSLQSCYAHQEKILVHSGQQVTRGQIIGLVDSTGHSTGPHLHFEARVGGSVRCMASYLGVPPKSVCYPGSPGY